MILFKHTGKRLCDIFEWSGVIMLCGDERPRAARRTTMPEAESGDLRKQISERTSDIVARACSFFYAHRKAISGNVFPRIPYFAENIPLGASVVSVCFYDDKPRRECKDIAAIEEIFKFGGEQPRIATEKAGCKEFLRARERRIRFRLRQLAICGNMDFAIGRPRRKGAAGRTLTSSSDTEICSTTEIWRSGSPISRINSLLFISLKNREIALPPFYLPFILTLGRTRMIPRTLKFFIFCVLFDRRLDVFRSYFLNFFVRLCRQNRTLRL